MNTSNNNGFTIIETLLFLSVSGLLAVGILAGSGAVIGQQRYRDSVNTLKSDIQHDYNKVSNTINNRSKDWSCDTNANTESLEIDNYRGTSECVLLGRLIVISDGDNITTSSVIGYRKNSDVKNSDVDELANYHIKLSDIDKESSRIGWQSKALIPGTDTLLNSSILILRSPLSGSIQTFISNNLPSTELNELVKNENQENPTVLCIAPSEGLFVGGMLAIKIDAFASNQGAITIRPPIPPEEDGSCD